MHNCGHSIHICISTRVYCNVNYRTSGLPESKIPVPLIVILDPPSTGPQLGVLRTNLMGSENYILHHTFTQAWMNVVRLFMRWTLLWHCSFKTEFPLDCEYSRQMRTICSELPLHMREVLSTIQRYLRREGVSGHDESELKAAGAGAIQTTRRMSLTATSKSAPFWKPATSQRISSCCPNILNLPDSHAAHQMQKLSAPPHKMQEGTK